LVPDAETGSLSPSPGRKVKGTRGMRAGRGAGQAASGWPAAPEATVASQLVPWTTME
jgi:hypothetical protein